ncbi:ABC transporter ATP-binding protein [Butyrivibrio sp. CB08]|uniref:ABC transporter ATP-binding protein n=1 Tax=Butyrivibrio sp. CB08 TaxID=2364879 RepID=UPI000EAA726A|nr:ABC transporter ATP-binding protein [Butyrivibrio sp. CB08]RKM59449.1 ABC transporter ATP-binding protein [Butyrivibrio sp. CB08]
MGNKETSVSIKRIIQNTAFMIKYAAKYDRPLIIKILVLFIVSKAMKALNDTFILKMIINGLTGKAEFSSIVGVLCVSFVLVICFEWIDELIEEWSKAKLIKLSGTIQRDLIENNSKMDLIYYDDPDYYDTYVIVANKADSSIEQTVMVVSKILGGIVALGVASAMILSINPVLALFPIAGFTVNLLTRFKIERIHYNWEIAYGKALRKADYSKRVFYQPEYAKECKLTDVKGPLRMQFDEALVEASDAGRKYAPILTWISILNWVSVFTVFSFFAVPAYLGYLALVLKSIALGEVASANNASNYVRRNLNEINFCLVDIQQIGQYAEKFRKMLDYKPTIEHAEGLTPAHEAQALKLENVSFKYPHAEKNTLDNISLEIKPGEKIAIVGENGAGKTTFVKLLMRLYDITSGSIKYGDHDIREYATDEYRKKIGAVFQDYNIYAATIAENVLMGPVKPEDEAAVISALEKADFSKKLKKLPDGINTVLTKEFDEEGTNLSGGESQKVAISRIFTSDGERTISILDEPSSALDPVSEYKLNRNLMENAKNDTIIFISHRLSTTRMADRIYLFEHGTIKEQGTHDELMQLGGRYREMFDRQAQNYIV